MTGYDCINTGITIKMSTGYAYIGYDSFVAYFTGFNSSLELGKSCTNRKIAIKKYI